MYICRRCVCTLFPWLQCLAPPNQPTNHPVSPVRDARLPLRPKTIRLSVRPSDSVGSCVGGLPSMRGYQVVDPCPACLSLFPSFLLLDSLLRVFPSVPSSSCVCASLGVRK
ncbi:hypothetical protein HDK64DRAFT_276268 [Phyllosticta capitalensis]